MCCVQTVDTSSKQTCGATLQPGLGLKIDQPFSNRANCTPAAPQLKPFKGGVNDIRAILIRRQLPTLHNFLNETERLPLTAVDDDAPSSPKLCGTETGLASAP